MSKRHVRKKAARVAAGGKPRWRVEGRALRRELEAATAALNTATAERDEARKLFEAAEHARAVTQAELDTLRERDAAVKAALA